MQLTSRPQVEGAYTNEVQELISSGRADDLNLSSLLCCVAYIYPELPAHLSHQSSHFINLNNLTTLNHIAPQTKYQDARHQRKSQVVGSIQGTWLPRARRWGQRCLRTLQCNPDIFHILISPGVLINSTNSLNQGSNKTLTEGQAVEFEIQDGQKGANAVNIKAV